MPQSERLPEIDALRGVAIVLMALELILEITRSMRSIWRTPISPFFWRVSLLISAHQRSSISLV